MNILLDYFFPITAIEPTPAASTAFLKQVCLVVSPAAEVTTGVITECDTMAEVAALTDNEDAQQLFNAGMSKVFILPMDDLDLASALEGHESDFFTVLISSDFVHGDVTASQATLTVNGDLTFTSVATGSGANAITVALVNSDAVSAGSEVVTVTGSDIVITIDAGVSTATQIKAKFDASSAAVALASCAIVSGQGAEAQPAAAEANLAGGDGLFLGEFTGVTGVWSDNEAFLETQAAIANRAAFYATSTNKAKNMCYAFGKMLSNSLSWLNQQYITMPVAEDVDTLGEANGYFDDKISFVISDDEFGERLALFACGGKAIVGPYIKRNLELDMQSAALSFISGNQPSYSVKNATLLEDTLQQVIDDYISTQQITAGEVSVLLEEDNFVASGYINISEPKALWRVFGEMRQTL
jgi:hypothetical protein